MGRVMISIKVSARLLNLIIDVRVAMICKPRLRCMKTLIRQSHINYRKAYQCRLIWPFTSKKAVLLS